MTVMTCEPHLTLLAFGDNLLLALQPDFATTFPRQEFVRNINRLPSKIRTGNSLVIANDDLLTRHSSSSSSASVA